MGYTFSLVSYKDLNILRTGAIRELKYTDKSQNMFDFTFEENTKIKPQT